MKKTVKIIILSTLVLTVFLMALGISGTITRRKNASVGTLGGSGRSNGISLEEQKALSPSFVAADSTTSLPQITTTTGRKIAIADYLTLQVNNLETSAKTVTEITKSYNGYVETYNVDNQGAYPSGTFTLKVPTTEIDIFIAELKTVGTYETGGRNAQDLTTEVINLEAQLNTLYAEEKVYVSFFDNAKTVKEMLEIQQSIQQVRSQIQSLEGQKKYYDNITSYASVQLTLTKKAASTSANTPIGFATAFKNSLENIKAGYAIFLTWLGGNLIAVLIWLIIISGLFLPMRKHLIKGK